MKSKEFGLITSSFGHGFMELAFSKAYNQTPVAFSEKTTKEEFEKEVEDIYLKLSPYVKNMEVCKWEDRETVLKQGISYRRKLLNKEIPSEMWKIYAEDKAHLKNHKTEETKAQFTTLAKDPRKRVLFIPHKVISDNMCGVSAKDQSVPLSAFEFLKNKPELMLVLGQHFHKINDLNAVEDMQKEFNLYVPGQTEDQHVFGIRGVNHTEYENMYKNIDVAVGIAGTHTWQMMATHPEIPQIILYNKGLEPWQDITRAMRKTGRVVYALGFDENTDWEKFSKQLECLFNKVETLSQKRDLEKAHTKHQVHSIQR